MLNKKLILPIIGAVLVALGVNLEEFGIDLKTLGGDSNNTTSSQTSSPNSSQTSSQNSSPAKARGYTPASKWSRTSPEINLHHVFEGEINRKGKPTGFHSRPGGVDPATAKIVRIKDRPNSKGVYTATIAVKDGGQWKEKFSSFFPDELSGEEVIKAIIHAYSKSSNKKKQPWRGPSGYGFDIQGYTTRQGGINTAFPVY